MRSLLGPGRTPAWKRLATPLKYLRISHAIKFRFDWGWPLILTAITMTVFWVLPVSVPIIGDGGILKGLRDFIALLAAFFVVALAAVATFAEPSLDEPMQGETPKLAGRNLSRRQFVCYLFGYLATLSFILFLVAISAQIIAPSLRATLPATLLWWVKAIGGTVYAMAFWNMMVTTLLGIYFLIERVALKSTNSGPAMVAPNDDNRVTRIRSS